MQTLSVTLAVVVFSTLAIAVRTSDVPVSADMDVTKWQTGIDLPDGFFDAN